MYFYIYTRIFIQNNFGKVAQIIHAIVNPADNEALSNLDQTRYASYFKKLFYFAY